MATLRIPPELSQPGVPRNNCIIENRVGDELRGLRAQLLQAGFPLCLWPYAARTYSTLENVRLRTDGNTPWYKRFASEPEFKQIPLGCLVWFIPAPTKYEVSLAAPRLMPGIFMGYRMAPGGFWGGEYIVVDLHDFKGISLHITTWHTKFRFHEHFVQKIALGPVVNGTRYQFPLRAKYERANVDIDALDAPQSAAADPLGDAGEAPK